MTREILMAIEKKLITTLVMLGLGTTTAMAGALERVNLDTSFMYEDGTQLELAYGSVNPSVPANWGFGSSDNIANRFVVSNFSAKTDIGDKIDIGVWSTNNSSGVSLDWGPTFPVKADLTVGALIGLVRYSFSENFSVMAGVKRVQSETGASVTTSLGAAGVGTYTVGSGSSTVGVYSVAYERPEIALRVELISEGAGSLNVDTNYSLVGGVADGSYVGPGTVGIGDAMTLKFQSGIAPNTLLFGAIRDAKWEDNQVVVPLPIPGMNSATLSTFGDGQEYTIGIGRKFTDSVSGSISTFYDPSSDCDDASPLEPQCENRSISLGAKIALADNMNLSLGTTWSRRGTATVNLGVPATTDKSVVTSLGAKLSYKFYLLSPLKHISLAYGPRFEGRFMYLI
jgi:long-subunit fatty acid transport protein